jgi:hypothetical protein
VLDDHNEKMDKINTCVLKVKDGELKEEEYTEKDHQKDLVVVYTQTTVNFIKLYALPVALGVASIACIVGGHRILTKRNVALMAAYKALEEGFAAYRRRVVEEHGEEADYMYKNGLRKMEVTEMAYTDENGVKHAAETKDKYLIDNPNNLSPYAKFYQAGCAQWSKDPEYNMYFLLSQQKYWNQILQAKGHVFLNEVYDALGIDRTDAGAIVGWMIGPGRDNHIDFGIFDEGKPRNRAFVNGDENVILLDFNVDGVIFDLFTKKKA